MATMVEESSHPIFTQDPANWMQYIYKKVRVLTGPNQEHVGHVYTVDPVTSSFVLVRFPDTTTSTAIATTTNVANSSTTTNTATCSTAVTSAAVTTKTKVEVCVIPGHAVVDVLVLQEEDNTGDADSTKDSDHEKIKARLDALFLNTKNSHFGYGNTSGNSSDIGHLSEEALSERKERLKSWLLKNRLPVTEKKREESGNDGDKTQCLCVAGAVTILPPYGPSNCCSTNEIILSRIQNLVRNMPPTV